MKPDNYISNDNQTRGWLTVYELAELCHLSVNTIKSRIFYQYYETVKQDYRGNKKIRYINIKDPAIPDTIREKYYASQPQYAFHTIDLDKAPTDSSGSTSLLRGRAVDRLPVPVFHSAMVPDNLKAIALSRLDLVKAWQDYRHLHGRGHGARLKADREFEKAYNLGILLPQLCEILGKVSMNTVYRWQRDLSGTTDWTLLVPDWKSLVKSEPSLTAIEKEVFSKCLLNPARMSIGEATKIAKATLIKRGIDSPSAPITFRRWAEWFKGKNSHLWTLIRDGEKALKDKEIFSIKRDTSKIQVGDVVIADGHRLNFQVINPFTGKPCRATIIGYLDWKSWNLAGYEIMIEESTQAIASALRNAAINLGKVPKIAYQDNGSAFRARFFTQGMALEESGLSGLFGRLGISPVYAQPYNARAKVIERWFKEFTGKFERLLPSFTGASIEDKPAWLMRNEKFHLIHHNTYIPTIQETIELVNTWVHEYLEIQPCPHVKGKTIGEVFRGGQGPGVNLQELDELMLATEIKTIRANGIRFLGADYYDDALFGLREHVFIKYSLSDLSHVKVYDRQGRFLCKADRTISAHPMAALLGEAKDVTEVRHLVSKQRSLQKAVVRAAKGLMTDRQGLSPWSDIVPLTPQTIKKLEETPSAQVETGERHIPECMLKKNQAEETELPTVPVTAEDSNAIERPKFEGVIERYEWHEKHGCQTKEDEDWVERFKTTKAYENYFGWFEKQAKGLVKDASGCGHATRR